LPKRSVMLRDWARFCYATVTGNVVPIRRHEDRAAAP
jgi:hypothetical protein